MGRTCPAWNKAATVQTSSGYTGFGLQEPTWKPLGIQNAFSIEMMFLMGESVPRHFETHSEAVSAHLLSRRGHGMGKRREGSRAREEKDRKETCQFSSLGTQHRLQLQLSPSGQVPPCAILPHLLSSPYWAILHYRTLSSLPSYAGLRVPAF